MILLLVSCTSDDSFNLQGDRFLIFGHFYGECAGEGCIETFKLTETDLFEDRIDDYLGQSRDFEALSDSDFELVKDLIDSFPQELWTEDASSLGCPDCGDWGGIHIEYYNGVELKQWRIDQIKESIPEYLHDFVDAVNENISIIQ